jgi:hypothetical protein
MGYVGTRGLLYSVGYLSVRLLYTCVHALYRLHVQFSIYK